LIRGIAFAVAIICLSLFSVAIWLQNYLDTPVILAESDYTLDVSPGSTLGGVAMQMSAGGVIRYPRLFSLYGRVSGQAKKIQAGEYAFVSGITPRDILAQMVSGHVRQHALTVIEGWTVRELLAAVRNHPAIVKTSATSSPEALAAAMSPPVSHAEGQFFPDTYYFPKGTTDLELFKQAHELLQAHLRELWAQRSDGLPLRDSYEALILASIVERETSLNRERAEVAGVFIRRLEKGMRLQTDPTVIYGLGDTFNGNLTRQHLQTDTPYNTYTRHGLPPTPIALPGKSSIAAVMQPADTRALYFVATGLGDGSHAFTSTLEEHNAAVARYLAKLRSQPKE
jgi:UPF0755 protein